MLLISWTGLLRADQRPFMILAGPRDVQQFHLKDEKGKTVWLLEAKPSVTPEYLIYGKIPVGFVQLDPLGDVPPRQLVAGEVVIMKTTSELIIFTHTGVASGSTTMEIVDYTMKHRPKAVTPTE